MNAAEGKCKFCGARLSADELRCDKCKVYRNFKSCVVCKAPMHGKATYCTECNSHQDARRYVNVSSTTLSLLTAITAAIAVVITQSGDFLNRNSKTSVVFERADADHVYVDVANTGRSGSVIFRCKLRFDETLQIAERDLLLVGEEKLPARRRIPANDEVHLKFLVEGLERHVAPGEERMTREQIIERVNDANIKDRDVTLVLVVDESNGEKLRRDQFRSYEISALIEKKLARDTPFNQIPERP